MSMSTITHRIGRMIVKVFDPNSEDRIEVAMRRDSDHMVAGLLVIEHADVDDLIHAFQGVPNTTKWQRRDEVGVEAGYLVAWLQQIAADGALAGSADAAQLIAIADAVLGHQHRSQIEGVRPAGFENNPSMTKLGRGPIDFDVEMATLLGFTEFELARCWQIVSAVVSSYMRMAAARAGHTRKCQQCEQWTFPDRECHLCAADEDRRIERSLQYVVEGDPGSAAASTLIGHVVRATGRYVCYCGAEHSRGPLNGEFAYRCLNCGRQGTIRLEDR